MRYNTSSDVQNIDFQLTHLLNEGLEFGDNIRGALLEEDLDIGENVIQHGLGFIPSGYIVLYKELEGDIFGSRVNQWTREQLFLRSSVANQKVRLFVM